MRLIKQISEKFLFTAFVSLCHPIQQARLVYLAVVWGATSLPNLVISPSLHGLLNILDGDKGLSCSLMSDILSSLVAAALLHCHSLFTSRFRSSQNLPYQGRRASFLDSTESYLENHSCFSLAHQSLNLF